MDILQVQGRLWSSVHYPVGGSSELPEKFASAEIINEEQLKNCHLKYKSGSSINKIGKIVKMTVWHKSSKSNFILYIWFVSFFVQLWPVIIPPLVSISKREGISLVMSAYVSVVHQRENILGWPCTGGRSMSRHEAPQQSIRGWRQTWDVDRLKLERTYLD
jgi:hypothetical protein